MSSHHFRTQIRIFAKLSIGLIAALMAAPALADAPLSGVIHVTVVSCLTQSTRAPSVTSSDSRGGRYQALHLLFKKSKDGIYKTDVVTSSPRVWLRADVGNCASESVPVTIISGHDRHILLLPSKPLGRLLLTSGDDWIYGTVPSGVGYIELRRADDLRLESIATIDDGCYYFDFIPPGSYVLRFELSPGMLKDVRVTVRGSKTGTRYDFGAADLLEIQASQ